MNRPVVLVTGPSRKAISGVTTHVNLLLDSALTAEYDLVHFQAGSEGRAEGPIERWLRLAFSPFALFAAIVFHHAAIVHINTSMVRKAFWRDLAYLLVAKVLRARVLWQVHGGALPQRFYPEGTWRSRMLQGVLGLPDMLVVLARVEQDAYQRFVPEQYVVTVPNAIDPAPFAKVPTVLSLPPKPLRAVYVGRLAREKGLYEAIQAIRLAADAREDLRLTIAGDGPEAPRLRRYATALGVSSRVDFAGPVFGDAKVALLARHDVFVLPSYSEGLPYSLLEAMAAGLPVVATPVGAVPDVMSHATHGYLVPVRDGKALAEALVALAQHRDQLPWMSRACRRRVRAAYAMPRLVGDFSHRYSELGGDVFVPAPPAAIKPAPARHPTRAA